MKKNIKTRKSKLALDLSFNKNYKVRKLEGDDTTQTTTGEPPVTVENNDVKSAPFVPIGTITPLAFKYSDNAKKREQEKQQAIQDVLDLNLPRKYEKSKLERVEEKYKPDNYSYVDNYSTPAYEEYKKDLRINPTPFLSPSRKHFTSTGHTYTLRAPFQVKSHYTNRYTNWLFDWYTDPTTQKILKENNIKPSTWYWDDNTGKPAYVPEDEDIIDAIVGTLNVPVIRGGFEDLNGNIIEDLQGAARSYGSPNTDGAIFINSYGSPKDNTYIHEYTHGISNALGYKNNNSGSYEEKEVEDYARLNELRHFLDLHPSKRDYTVEDTKNIINYLKTLDKEGKYHLSPYILNWSAEELQTMLNTWASNNLDNKSNRLAIPQQLNNNDYGIEQTDTITVAKNGGKLNFNKYGGGGKKESQTSAEVDAKLWLRNWYGNPTTQQMMSSLDNRDYSKDPVVTPNGTSISDPNDARKAIVSMATTTPVKYTDEFNDNKFGQTYQSAYDPNKYLIKVNSNINGSALVNTLLHEYDHVIQDKMPFLEETTKPVLHLLKPGVHYDDYLDTEKETRSRIIEARKSLNLDPSKRDYTPEEAAKIQKSLVNMGSAAGNAGSLDRLTPETMAGYLNYLAENNTFIPNTEDVSYAKFGGKLNNKYAGGGKMAKASSAVAKKAFSNGNGASTIAGLASGALNIAESAIANAEVDTSSATNAIEATQNHQLDTNSLDALAASYNTAPWASEDLNFKDFRPGAGELIMNTAKAGIQGLSSGASAGGPWGAIAGAAVGLGSAIGGMFAGRAKAKKEEARLEAEAKLANQQLQAQAESNRDLIMQQQASAALRNVAAEGGQLDTYKEGEEYDLSAKEIKKLKSQGYDIDLGYNINDEVDIDPSDIQTLRELGYEFDIV